MRRLALIIIGLGLACARRAPEPSAPDGAASSPVAPPEVGVDGCVESEELKAFVEALEARRSAARDAALAAHGARLELRRGTFVTPAARKMGDVFELGGKRLVVMAEYTRESEPLVALAVQGHEVRRVEERPKAHGVPVRACGITACPRSDENMRRRPVLPVAVELGATEAVGEVLLITYDYWWAQVSHAEREPCPSAS